MVSGSRIAVCSFTLFGAACGGFEPPSTTGGVSVTAGRFGRGHALVMSDYQSTNVALLDCEGHTLSPAFVSSAAATPGLSAPLSGDVVLPGESQFEAELALIDRYPAAVVTLVDIVTGSVSAQLDVSTGFRSNPQDLVHVGDELWVSRYETNAKPGKLPFDAGGDILVLDRRAQAIIDRIDLASAVADAPGFLPRPGKMARSDNRLYVLLAAYDASFQSAAASRIVQIDLETRQIVATHVLSGLSGCSALTLEPRFDAAGDERPMRRLLVGCSGAFQGSSTPTLKDSGLVMLATDPAGPQELRRWTPAELGDRPVGFDLTIDEGGRALVTTMGHLGDGVSSDLPDALVEVRLDAPTTRVVFTTDSRPFELGGVRCTTMLTHTESPVASDELVPRDCFAADGERGVLRRLVLGTAGYEVAESLVVEAAIGLPPRWLGRF